MAYKPVPTINFESDENIKQFLIDIGSRKEFNIYIDKNEKINTLDPSYGDTEQADPVISGLRLHKLQEFIRIYMSPKTPYKRILLNWQTGAGKTIGAVMISQEFVNIFNKMDLPQPPSIFVIGFTKTIIQDAMLKHSMYISEADKREVNRLRNLAIKSNNPASEEYKRFNIYMGVLKRRFTNKKKGGYYNFMGYKEFANKLFKLTNQGIRNKFSISELYVQNDDKSLIEYIESTIKAGNITINVDLLNSMKYGLIISDEIHNTYNIQSTNNYGIALQYALNYLTLNDQLSAPRAIFMSATVMGGSALEIIDLLNLLVPINELPNKKRLNRDDFFAKNDDKSIKILPGALEKIGLLSAGRVSFMSNESKTQLQQFPRRKFVGVSLYDIKYLKFIPCKISKLHENTIIKLKNLSDNPNRLAVPIQNYSIYDMVYPNPDSTEIGMFNSAEIPVKIINASQKWKNSVGINVKSIRGNNVRADVPNLYFGKFLNNSKNGIQKYSSKYHKMLLDLFDVIKNKTGKCMIYHHKVQTSGVLQIQELLNENGFINEISPPTSNTMCSKCGVLRKNHKNIKTHNFIPCRYVIFNSEIDKNTMRKSLEKFNSQDNNEGDLYKVLIGSKIIKESYTLLAVQYQFIMSLPTDISSLIQVFGRVVRRNSHKNLPQNEREVLIRIYVSYSDHMITPELERYKEKMQEYHIIQEIDKIIRSYAVNVFIKPVSNEKDNQIDNINFKPRITQSDIKHINDDTYKIYGYLYKTINTVKLIIEKLFHMQVIWLYDDLFKAVNSNIVQGVAENHFDETAYAIALNDLLNYNPNSINVNKIGFKIVRINDYYIKLPTDKNGHPIIDIESYIRENTLPEPVLIDVNRYVKLEKSNQDFMKRFIDFKKQFNVSNKNILSILVDYDEHFHESLITNIIENYGVKTSIFYTELLDKESLLSKIYKLYRSFKIIIETSDIVSIPQISMIVKNDLSKKNVPIGYISLYSIKFYEGKDKQWYNIMKKSLYIGLRHVENDVSIGYIERKGTKLNFKIRNPLHIISAAVIKDVRSLERGVVCETKSRIEQVEILTKLKLSNDLELNSCGICKKIMYDLLKRERDVRNTKNGMFNGTRWFYLFNDVMPSIT